MAQSIAENEAFRNEVVQLLGKHRPQWVLELTKDQQELKWGNYCAYLGNLQKTVADDKGEARNQAILDFFDKVFHPSSEIDRPRNFSEIKNTLVARVVPTDYAKGLCNTPSGILLRPFSRYLNIGYVFEDADNKKENSSTFVLNSDLSTWKISIEDLHKEAVANLEKASENVEVHFIKAEDGKENAAFSIESDSLDAARLLAPKFLSHLRTRLSPKIFIAIPNRDFLVAWRSDFVGKKIMAARAKADMQKQPYPLTDELFVSTDDGVRLANAEELAEHGL